MIMAIVHASSGVTIQVSAVAPFPRKGLAHRSGTVAVQVWHSAMRKERVMSTSDIKFETLISSGFPELNRFRLNYHSANSRGSAIASMSETFC